MAYRLNMVMNPNTPAILIQTEHDIRSKMGGIPSFSTCCLMNKACLARMQKGFSVCAHCFSAALQKIRKGLKLTTTENFIILNSAEILIAPKVKWTRKALAINPDKLTRIESFGDVDSVLQAVNYIKIVKANPDCLFAAWTKNLAFWVKAFEKEGKPENMTLVFSSLQINMPDIVPDWARKWVDHRFTVYTKEWLLAHGVESNCAGISCAQCQRCYHKGGAFDILEILR